jgi:cystathionine beta-lyase
MKFNTKTIHGGQHHDPSTGAVMPPISNNYICTKPGQPIGIMNIAELQTYKNRFRKCTSKYREWSKRIGFSSGLAATDCLMRGLKAGR